MIALDTSALMAILQEEPKAEAVKLALENAKAMVMSAGTLAETLVVARRRGGGSMMAALIDRLKPDIVPVTRDFADKVADAYDAWGKGVHPAGLNFSDCFAYALAKERACPLLYVGADFAQTDIVPAIAP